MAEIQLKRSEIRGGLPPVCIQCGASAETEVVRKLHNAHLPHPILPEDPVGCLLFPISLLMMLGVKATRDEVSVTMPTCRRHASTWWNWSPPELKSADDEVVLLSGVSEEFVSAVNEHRATRGASDSVERTASTDPEVRIRCRDCGALNSESARFCDQCGHEL